MSFITKIACALLGMFLFAGSIATASVPLPPRKNAAGKSDMFGCMQSNAFYIVNFASYQADPQTSTAKQPGALVFCQDLPGPGPTQFTVDLLDRDVRHKSVWIKVFNPDKQVLFETPKVVAKQGVITANLDLPIAAIYDVVVYVDDTDLHIATADIGALHIPLYAGVAPPEQPTSGLPVILFLAFTAVVVIVLGWYLPRKLKA